LPSTKQFQDRPIGSEKLKNNKNKAKKHGDEYSAYQPFL
jgi:hypothetical protein